MTGKWLIVVVVQCEFTYQFRLCHSLPGAVARLIHRRFPELATTISKFEVVNELFPISVAAEIVNVQGVQLRP
jgi:hypothetical protein